MRFLYISIIFLITALSSPALVGPSFGGGGSGSSAASSTSSGASTDSTGQGGTSEKEGKKNIKDTKETAPEGPQSKSEKEKYLDEIEKKYANVAFTRSTALDDILSKYPENRDLSQSKNPVDRAQYQARQDFYNNQNGTTKDKELFQKALDNAPASQEVLAYTVPYAQQGGNIMGDVVFADRNGNELYRAPYRQGKGGLSEGQYWTNKEQEGQWGESRGVQDNFNWSSNYKTMATNGNSLYDIHPMNEGFTDGCLGTSGFRGSSDWKKTYEVMTRVQSMARAKNTQFGFYYGGNLNRRRS